MLISHVEKLRAKYAKKALAAEFDSFIEACKDRKSLVDMNGELVDGIVMIKNTDSVTDREVVDLLGEDIVDLLGEDMVVI